MEDIVFIFPIPRIQIYDAYTYTQGPFLTFQLVTKAKLQSYLLILYAKLAWWNVFLTYAWHMM